jgi:hypothetical protein
MAELRIQTRNDRVHFAPGETIEGIVSWNLDHVKSATLRLFWRTEGKGTQDVGLSAEMPFDEPRPSDERTFRFNVPEGPWSYDGKLVAIVWSLELETEPGGKVESLDLVVSPQPERVEA